jgi:hypothetical protein
LWNWLPDAQIAVARKNIHVMPRVVICQSCETDHLMVLLLATCRRTMWSLPTQCLFTLQTTASFPKLNRFFPTMPQKDLLLSPPGYPHFIFCVQFTQWPPLKPGWLFEVVLWWFPQPLCKVATSPHNLRLLALWWQLTLSSSVGIVKLGSPQDQLSVGLFTFLHFNFWNDLKWDPLHIRPNHVQPSVLST